MLVIDFHAFLQIYISWRYYSSFLVTFSVFSVSKNNQFSSPNTSKILVYTFLLISVKQLKIKCYTVRKSTAKAPLNNNPLNTEVIKKLPGLIFSLKLEKKCFLIPVEGIVADAQQKKTVLILLSTALLVYETDDI